LSSDGYIIFRVILGALQFIHVDILNISQPTKGLKSSLLGEIRLREEFFPQSRVLPRVEIVQLSKLG
jgi:hypothetical protein